jgi:hypothetical protein
MKNFFSALKNSYNNFIEEVEGRMSYKDAQNNPLHLAVMDNNLERILETLKSSTLQDINAYNANGQTPFDISVSLGKSEVACVIVHWKALLEEGELVNNTSAQLDSLPPTFKSVENSNLSGESYNNYDY